MTNMTDAVKSYLRGLQARNFSPETMRKYTRTLNELVDWLAEQGKHTLAEVDRNDLEKWMVNLRRRGITTRVRYASLRLVKRFSARMKERGDVLIDVAANIEDPKLPDPLPEAPPTEDELGRLLDTLPATTPVEIRDKALIEMLYGCMLRIGEALALKVSDVDLDDHLLRIRRGKGGKGRSVPIPRRTGDALEKYLEVRLELAGKKTLDARTRSTLFLSDTGKRLTQDRARTRLRMLAETYGLKRLHPHCFRHAGATHMLRAGADIRHVQEILGHADLEATAVYTRLVPSDLKKAYDEAFPHLRV